MPAELRSYCLQGLDAVPVSVEVDASAGMPYFSVIGMASMSVKEAADRVRSAIKHSGFKFPMTRKVVNLAPAEFVKRGSHFDLPIAIGLLVVDGQMKALPNDVMLIGELGLEGGLREVSGILPGILFAKEQGMREVILPAANLAEASFVDGVKLIPVKSLMEVFEHFELEARAPAREMCEKVVQKYAWDFSDITGHESAKRALLIAAAGGHHVLLNGPPGTGKSLLARAFPSILPPLSKDEMLDVMRIYSLSLNKKGLNNCRPFRKVHSSCTSTGLIGGGSKLLPGELSLAHKGVLFMDEFAEFKRDVLESLRSPLEDGRINLRRAGVNCEYPCEFQLIAAMNPCPCGHYGDRQKICVCNAAQIARYQGKLSGPLMDRIDLRIEVPRVDFEELNGRGGASSAEMRAVVLGARERQRARGLSCNNAMSAKQVKAEPMSVASQDILSNATKNYALSGRAVHRLIKVARTIADIEGSNKINEGHLYESLQYRRL
ncbi:YifB family Mg chelatase-like AAA ATPase [Candidatus Peregrinibacteria bacterium]|jgi:magnesium chelatase family protein|nr:YifB family Mg chelatase-like AAA ATPase [Candidatus Peregrinibacteria bacterium]